MFNCNQKFFDYNFFNSSGLIATIKLFGNEKYTNVSGGVKLTVEIWHTVLVSGKNEYF